MKGIDVSAMSLHKMLAVAKKMDAINEGGSVVALTYMAAQRTYPFYTDMADIKAMLESIARSFGYHYGVDKKVRINTVSQSPTRTTAGSGIKGFDNFFDFSEETQSSVPKHHNSLRAGVNYNYPYYYLLWQFYSH